MVPPGTYVKVAGHLRSFQVRSGVTQVYLWVSHVGLVALHIAHVV